MDYITEFTPIVYNELDIDYLVSIETKIKNNESLSEEEITYFLNSLIYLTRYKINPNMDNYDYKCDLAQAMLTHYFNRLKVTTHPAETQNTIGPNNIDGHSFLTIELFVENEKRNYLIDPTYIQFFHKENCSGANYFVSEKYPDKILKTPDAGYFIDEESMPMVNVLLNQGYMPLTEEVAKVYGNSFYNTRTLTNPKKLTRIKIPGSVYIEKFLRQNCKLSKTEEELESTGMFLTSFEDLNMKK